MIKNTKLRESAFQFKRAVSRSKALGKVTDFFGIHSDTVGRVTKVVDIDEILCGSSIMAEQHFAIVSPSIHRNPPHTLEEQIHGAFLSYSSYAESDYELISIPEARVISELGWVLTKEKDFIRDSSPEPDMYSYNQIKNIVLWPRVQQVHEQLILAYNRWSLRNYYHWILESLPKISMYLNPPNASIAEYLGGSKLLLPSNPNPLIQRSLAMIGFPENKILYAPAKQLCIDQLIYLPTFGKKYEIPTWAMRWLKNSFSPYFCQTEARGKRLYITRKLATTRKITNEDEVLKLLSYYGFEEVILENMDLVEQISLFSQAEVIIGPHGAGFTNMVFSTKATLIEIFEPSHVHPCYYVICNDTEQRYWYVMGRTEEKKNIYVDVDKLQRTLDKALDQRLEKVSS